MSLWSKTKEFFAWFFKDVPRSPIMPPIDAVLPEPSLEEKPKKAKSATKKKPAKKTKRKTSNKKK